MVSHWFTWRWGGQGITEDDLYLPKLAFMSIWTMSCEARTIDDTYVHTHTLNHDLHRHLPLRPEDALLLAHVMKLRGLGYTASAPGRSPARKKRKFFQVQPCTPGFQISVHTNE